MSFLLPRVMYLGFLCFTAIQATAQTSIPSHQRQETGREATDFEDRAEHDDLQAAARYWYESRNPKQLPDMEEALAGVLPKALTQSPWVTSLPTWEEAHHHQAYHDAGAILLAKCYALLYYGRVQEARSALDLVDTKFPHSLMLYKDRTVIQVRKSLRYHEQACALYAGIVSKKMDVFVFPPERDEFDAHAQRKACEDMAMLRLKEGDYDSLEHYAMQARVRQLKTASGQWVSEMIYRGMHPLQDEQWSYTAWEEMGDRIKEWRKRKPSSIDARIGELVYEISRMIKFPSDSQSMSALLARLRASLDELGPMSPIIPELQMLISFSLNEDFSIAARHFHEGYEKFPDYPNNLVTMFLRLIRDPKGKVLGTDFLDNLATSDHPETMALVLGALPPELVILFSDGMDVPKLEAAIRRTLELYPHSFEVRNDLGRLAVLMKMPELAREVMRPVGQRWDRIKWKGLEEQAAGVTEDRSKQVRRART
ncbi:hypothetical protein EI77_00489 [Prosthecobacter fusiformis]|uniref:Tetratricopeptide repeat protein n=1 Tax=Prosthecobacter fusiformis TaxID=48464 RepID=A0A4R7SRT9_9BACT|nr:hypothetical protein [Prosthecobacter fusiformis]TDU81186.1 hypothetical protein EI77_00489 [Prosthecobacter fusiformis]